jgi:RNA polymerase sigma-70 factor, ECF subfamily
VIKWVPTRDVAALADSSIANATDLEGGPPRDSLESSVRVERFVRDNYPLIWRLARRWGLSSADADDVAQQAVVIASRRLAEITPGAERAFLCRATLFLASKLRRGQRRRAEETVENWENVGDRRLDPERMLEQRRACAELDAVLDELPEDLRAAFVLFELELQTQLEVAEALQIPQGTVASRVRRARELVAKSIERRVRSHQRIGAGR